MVTDEAVEAAHRILQKHYAPNSLVERHVVEAALTAALPLCERGGVPPTMERLAYEFLKSYHNDDQALVEGWRNRDDERWHRAVKWFDARIHPLLSASPSPATERGGVPEAMPEREEDVDQIVAQYSGLINGTPELLSLLYDIDMLPEQCRTRVGAVRLAGLCEVWKRYESAKLASGPASPFPASDDAAWASALACACSVMESHARRGELNTIEGRQSATDDALQHAVGILRLRSPSPASADAGGAKEIEWLRTLFPSDLLNAAYQALSYVARHAPETQAEETEKRALDFRAAIRAYEQAIRERKDAGGAWHTMESAPKDGTRVLLFERGRGAFEGWWNCDWPKSEAYWMDDQDSEPEPTSWRPLLPPPSSDGGVNHG